MQKALFDSIALSIMELIDKANTSIKIAMAWFTNDELFTALLNARNRGISVDLILLDDAINWLPYAPEFNKLIEAGGSIYIATREIGFMHHKFCIIDDFTTITGSYNWTYYAESRNIENILITDDKSIVKTFEEEFNRIISKLSSAVACPKFDQEEINQIDNIDYDILNFEVEEASKKNHIDYTPIVKPQHNVKIVEKRTNPTSRFNIGFRATKGANEDCRVVLINQGKKIPCTEDLTVYGYLEGRDSIWCDLLYGNSPIASENIMLKTRPLKDITDGCKSKEFNINISITLNENGYLLAVISCNETKKAIELTLTNSDLVKYE